jgi:S-adenosylmethionine hydrolase
VSAEETKRRRLQPLGKGTVPAERKSPAAFAESKPSEASSAAAPALPTRQLITLLTDYGLRDIYAGVLRGVIMGIAPQATIVDLSHEVGPQAVAEAAFLLDAAAPYFPWGTIHVSVVDPGVGTERRIICARTARATYLAPDNGLLARVLERDPPAHLVSVENPAHFLPKVSTTFHGRDIFAPVAAHLANGLDPRALGPEVRELQPLPMPRPREVAPGVLSGAVIHIDRFGNIVTNVGEPFAHRVQGATLGATRIEGPVCRAYGDRDEGEPLLIFGSAGFLEVSINGGDAARTFSVRRGDPIAVELEPSARGSRTHHAPGGRRGVSGPASDGVAEP